MKKELSDLGLVPEDWGGQTVTVPVSAKKRENIPALLEMVLLVTELSELKANPKRNASGTVLEAKLDKGRGPVATILVQDGTLRVGDTLIAGTIVGKVRAIIDDRGKPIKVAGPSTPVEVLGLGGLPLAGRRLPGARPTRPRRARSRTTAQTQAKDKAHAGRGARLTLESLQAQIAEGGMKELPIIIKADVQGSAEVLADTLTKLSDDRVKIRIIHSGVGAINESDVLLGAASNAIIIGFNVRPDRNAAERRRSRRSVDIRLHSVIYNVTDEMKKAMTGLLDPTMKEVRIGVAQVRDLFKTPKFGTIAGCMVTEGRDHALGRYAGAPAARRPGRPRGQDRLAPPLQGRRVRGQVGHRVRHRLREVQRHQGRRRDRGVRGRARRRNGVVAGNRPDQVGEQIRIELSGLIARDVHDPGIGFITLTKVSVTPDLQIARVYYTSLGDEKAQQGNRQGAPPRLAVPAPPDRPAGPAPARAGARVLLRQVGRPVRPGRADPAGAQGRSRRPAARASRADRHAE